MGGYCRHPVGNRKLTPEDWQGRGDGELFRREKVQKMRAKEPLKLSGGPQSSKIFNYATDQYAPLEVQKSCIHCVTSHMIQE